MFRKFILSVVMLIPFVGAAASHVPIPVLVVMGILILLAVSVRPTQIGTKDENP